MVWRATGALDEALGDPGPAPTHLLVGCVTLESHSTFLDICKIRGLNYKTWVFGPRRATKMGRASTFQDLLNT